MSASARVSPVSFTDPEPVLTSLEELRRDSKTKRIDYIMAFKSLQLGFSIYENFKNQIHYLRKRKKIITIRNKLFKELQNS